MTPPARHPPRRSHAEPSPEVYHRTAHFLNSRAVSGGGNGGPTPLTPGTFEATLSGEISAAARGTAVFVGGGTSILLTDGRVPSQSVQLILQTSAFIDRKPALFIGHGRS